MTIPIMEWIATFVIFTIIGALARGFKTVPSVKDKDVTPEVDSK
jgi:hypothetical protein